MSAKPLIQKAFNVLNQYSTDARRSRMDDILRRRTGHKVVVGFERITNLYNVQAAMRTLDGFGIQNVHLLASQNQRASQGVSTMVSKVSLTRHATTKEGIDDLKSQGYKILASDLSPGAVSLFDLRETLSNPDEKFCFMFGNESDGITDELRQMSDMRWYIPMMGMSTSFNIGISVAVLMAYLRRENFIGVNGDMTDDEKDLLKLQWTIESVAGARPILERSGVSVAELEKLIKKPTRKIFRQKL